MKRLLALLVTLTTFAAFAPVATAKGEKPEPRRHSVSIEDLKYKPAETVIAAGETVVWTNNDDREHTVTAADGSFKSGRMGSGKTYEHTFTRPGRYLYGDDFFGRMAGVIVVK